MDSMPVYLDDKRLVKQLLVGDRQAFDRFFEENFARLYRFAMARLADDPEAARDAVQITLTRAVRKLGSYRAESALFTWLCAICRNEISDHLRRDAKHRDHVLLIEDFPEIQAAVDSLQSPAEDGPERLYQREASIRLIQVALDRLPPKYGDILEWKYVQGHSVQEIAAKLRIGAEAAQSMLARARRAFADVYSSMNGVESDDIERLVRS
jgi:RNA polymerase sigma-70 factor (ECF subfamily)